MDVQDDECGGDNTVGSVLDLPPSPFRAASALLLSEDQEESLEEQTGVTIREELEPQPSPTVQVTPPCDVNSPPGGLILSQSRPLPLTDVTNDLSTAARTAEVPPVAADVSSAQTPPHLSRIVTLPSIPRFSMGTTLPGSSRERPRPRPAYIGKLGVRAEAEAKNAETTLKAATDSETTTQRPNPEVEPPRRLPPALLSPPHSPAPPATDSETTTQPPNPEVDVPRCLPPASVSPPHSPAPPATISGTTMAEDHGRRRRTLTEFSLQHAKEIEEKNAKAERSKLKRESLAKSKGKRTGTKEAAAGTKSDKRKGKK